MMMLASHIFANSQINTETLPGQGGWARWPRFKLRRREARKADKARPQDPAAQRDEATDAGREPSKTSGHAPVINTAAADKTPFSLRAMLSANAAAAAGNTSGTDGQDAELDASSGSCRRRRLRFFQWRRRRCGTTHRERLPRYLRRFARRLKLDAEQRQQLLDLLIRVRALRREFAERGSSEAEHWTRLMSAERFDSEAAMTLLRGHGQWWEENLAELLMQYAALHDSLQAEQRERLVQVLHRMFRRKRRGF